MGSLSAITASDTHLSADVLQIVGLTCLLKCGVSSSTVLTPVANPDTLAILTVPAFAILALILLVR